MLVKKFDLHILNVFNSNKTFKSFGDGNTDNPAEATKQGYPKWWIVNTKVTYYWKKLIILNMGVYNLFDIHYKTFSSGISAITPRFSSMSCFASLISDFTSVTFSGSRCQSSPRLSVITS